MSNILQNNLELFSSMSKLPKNIYYKGDVNLLQKRKISIVGTRKPFSYTKQATHHLASKLSSLDIVVVSGAAIGVDAIAHNGANSHNTIAVVANGLDIRYPKINSKLIEDIENKGLVLSQVEDKISAKPYSFVLRNELVVALGEVLIITQADLNSGSLHSAKYAIKQNKEIYVLAHRAGESLGTNKLLEEGIAKPIYDIDKFIQKFGDYKSETQEDEFLNFCKNNPIYEKVLEKYKSKLFEYELSGKIKVENGQIYII